MLHSSNTGPFKAIYFAYLHSIMQYGIILGGKSFMHAVYDGVSVTFE
jgi:hypothetical protein